MKNAKKMISLVGLVAMLCSVNSFAKNKSKNNTPVSGEAIRSLDWASDANAYPILAMKAECFQLDAKHFVWQTSLHNGSDGVLEVRGMKNPIDIDAQSTVDGSSFEVKSCDKRAVLKLDARTKGEKTHFDLVYTDGAMVAHEKQPKNWGGFAMALAMVGTSAMSIQAANQAQFGATLALRNAGAARADQLGMVQDALSQAEGAQQAADDSSDGDADSDSDSQ